MDMVIFMTTTLIVAIACGLVTYHVALTSARREIEEAFQRHIEAMHEAHRELVEAIEPAPPESKG
jgi:hypothetical protein